MGESTDDGASSASPPRRRSVAEERAAAQAAARSARSARAANPPDESPESVGPIPGRGLVRFTETTTVVFTVVAIVAAVLEPNVGAARNVAVISMVAVSLALGVVGVGFFVLALVWGAERSRTAEMTMAGWWFLAGGVAPRRVRRGLLASLAVQVVVSFVVAGVRPFTELAFATLVPICALALCGTWAAKYGSFPSRRTQGSAAKR